MERGLRDLDAADLPDGDVEIRVDWSSVNFKDGSRPVSMARSRASTRSSPGSTSRVRSLAAAIRPSRSVRRSSSTGTTWASLATAAMPSTSACPPAGRAARDGPFDARGDGHRDGQVQRVVIALEDHGLRPGDGPVLVTGASGGVGSTAVAILAQRGHEVWAATGKADEADRLLALGAAGIMGGMR